MDLLPKLTRSGGVVSRWVAGEFAIRRRRRTVVDKEMRVEEENARKLGQLILEI